MSPEDYEVGYGKPPQETRFQKGRSGNPAGRRKGTKNISTLVEEALAETVTINVAGRRRKVSKLQAAFMQQANKAAAGDPKAMKVMLDVMGAANARNDAQAAASPTTPQQRREQDQLILQALSERLKGPGHEPDER